MGFIYILEFGGQHTDLIGNRFEEMGFPVKYAPSSAPLAAMPDADGIILSGGPKSVNDPNKFPYDPDIFKSNVPVLGICYGMQLIGHHHGGQIHDRTREYGETRISVKKSRLFKGFDDREIVWMNHGDSVSSEGAYEVLARSDKGVTAAIKVPKKLIYGVQFHPEVTHTQKGNRLLRNFAEEFCRLKPSAKATDEFDSGKFIDDAVAKLKEECGNRRVVVYTSGGVDSTVAAYLANLAGLDVQPVYLEMGNGRLNEAQSVAQMLENMLGRKTYVHDRSDHFVRELYGLDDPEVKRKKFAKLYAETDAEVKRIFGLDADAILVQGTIATDRRESGIEAGKRSSNDSNTVDTIKTHHNVHAEKLFRSIAPLAELTKDRVRKVARDLGLPSYLHERQPFPGPGLFVRLATGQYEVPEELSDDVYDLADDEFRLDAAVLPVKGVGLKGDSRAFEHAVFVTDFERRWDAARAFSKSIIEDLPICRVLYLPRYDGAPVIHQRKLVPQKSAMAKADLDRLRTVTFHVEETMREYGVKAAQVPVISFETAYGPMNVIRDVDSQDFRTCRPLSKPDEFPWECYDDIRKRLNEALGEKAGITVFDASDKPGGTTEWE